jgi:hypothetical protein
MLSSFHKELDCITVREKSDLLLLDMFYIIFHLDHRKIKVESSYRKAVHINRNRISYTLCQSTTQCAKAVQMQPTRLSADSARYFFNHNEKSFRYNQVSEPDNFISCMFIKCVLSAKILKKNTRKSRKNKFICILI